MKYKEIIGGTRIEAEKKFPWLKEASFTDAIIDIKKSYLTWKDGTWEHGLWEGGTWEGGTWEHGLWESGTWKDGIWKDGVMWSNLYQKYLKVTYDGKNFKESE